MGFLQATLADGPVSAADIDRMSVDHGFTKKVVRSAREALQVKVDRDGFGPGSKSMWSLPRAPYMPNDHIDAQQSNWASMTQEGTYGADGE
jgi:hypothetical protein